MAIPYCKRADDGSWLSRIIKKKKIPTVGPEAVCTNKVYDMSEVIESLIFERLCTKNRYLTKTMYYSLVIRQGLAK